jgi:hypothetical protein
MPKKPPGVAHIRIYRPNASDAEILARTRECLEQARALLQLRPPSTFLGRRECEQSSARNDGE